MVERVEEQMTIAAARIFKDAILFASDQQVTAGYRKRIASELKYTKVASINGMTIAGAGRLSHCQWLFYFARNHAPLSDSEIDISSFLMEYFEWMRSKDSGFVFDAELLIAYRSSLFRVHSQLEVFRVPEFSAIGTGSDYAIAAMHLGYPPKEAAKVAMDLDVYCGGSVDVIEHQIDKETK